jgi:hypothetical protein
MARIVTRTVALIAAIALTLGFLIWFEGETISHQLWVEQMRQFAADCDAYNRAHNTHGLCLQL